MGQDSDTLTPKVWKCQLALALDNKLFLPASIRGLFVKLCRMEHSCSLFFFFLKRTTLQWLFAQAIATVVWPPVSIVQRKSLFFPFLCWAGITQSPSSVQGFWRTWARTFRSCNNLTALLDGSSSGARVLSSPACTGSQGIGWAAFQSFFPSSSLQENVMEWGWSSSPTP